MSTLKSKNGYDLITQPKYCPEEYPMLTVNRGKMYGVYLVYSDGTKKDVDIFSDQFSHLFIGGVGWYDHCIHPRHFHYIAEELKAGYDNETMLFVIESFVINYLNSDWSRLAVYLPDSKNRYLDKNY
ncbi:hypothetical protein D3C71_1469740 [compost metagenome]